MTPNDDIAIRRAKKLRGMIWEVTVYAFAIFGAMTFVFILYMRLKFGI